MINFLHNSYRECLLAEYYIGSILSKRIYRLSVGFPTPETINYLTNAKLQHANLEGANLEGAILIDSNLSHANLNDAVLLLSNLWKAIFRNAKLKNIDIIKHIGPSLSIGPLEMGIGYRKTFIFCEDAEFEDAEFNDKETIETLRERGAINLPEIHTSDSD